MLNPPLKYDSPVCGKGSAALGTDVPFTNDHNRSDIYFSDRPLPEHGQFPHPDHHEVSADYLKVIGQPLLLGRAFTDADNESAPNVGYINERLARTFFGDHNPIGKQFTFGGKMPQWITIVGVVDVTREEYLDRLRRALVQPLPASLGGPAR